VSRRDDTTGCRRDSVRRPARAEKDAAELLESVACNRELLAEISERNGCACSRRRATSIARRGATPPAREGQRQTTQSRKNFPRPIQASRNRHPQIAPRKSFHHAECFPPKNFVQEEVKENPDFREVVEPQNCYICKKDYSTIHHFYDQLCPACAELNFFKRTETADLRGRVALLTGGRVKIGYQAGIKLLRAGVNLIVCTRFPRDSAMRYSQEPDFAEWKDGWKFSDSICATRRASRRSANICSRRAIA
jgi:hypothetical protein